MTKPTCTSIEKCIPQMRSLCLENTPISLFDDNMEIDSILDVNVDTKNKSNTKTNFAPPYDVNMEIVNNNNKRKKPQLNTNKKKKN
jgi:hypothetical protein